MPDTPCRKQVVMGMSCVGKTIYAKKMTVHGYHHYSFDGQFTYKLTGLGGVSRKKNWERIIRGCTADRFILDNWTTEDPLGETLYANCPDAAIVVLFDTYPNILKRYRVPVKGEDAFFWMYEKMYLKTPFEQYKRVEYLQVQPEYFDRRDVLPYKVHTAESFREFIAANLTRDTGLTYDSEDRTWK